MSTCATAGSQDATGSACPFCLRTHGEEGCVCAKCGCGLHPLFQRRAFIGSDPAVICPRCAEPPNHHSTTPVADCSTTGALTDRPPEAQ